ncbi:hypothetical protein IGI50_004088 [Enterococcus sp. DIV0170]|mgnify:CR=1 FL=1
MGRYRNKLLGLLFLLLLILLLLVVPRKNSPNKTTQKISTVHSSSVMQPIDTSEFLESLSGKWESEELSQVIEFKKIDNDFILEIKNAKNPNEDERVEFEVVEHLTSDNRWMLKPLKRTDSRFNLKQLSQNEIVFFSATTREKTEGVSKPISYFRVE